MNKYYLENDENTNGEHEIHMISCNYKSKIDNLIFIGLFTECKYALLEAQEIFKRVNGCSFCCNSI
jgi:hypothetical protein